MTTIIPYDIETLNVFTICYIIKDNPRYVYCDDEICVGLLEFLSSIEGNILAGYNNWKFDDPLLRYWLGNIFNHTFGVIPNDPSIGEVIEWVKNFSVYHRYIQDIEYTAFEIKSDSSPSTTRKIATDIIEGKIRHWQVNSIYSILNDVQTIDVQETLGLKKGLKSTAHRVNYPHLKEFSISWDKDLSDEDIPELLEYNAHDVFATKAIYEYASNSFKLRQDLVGFNGLTHNEAYTRSAKLGEIIITKALGGVDYPENVNLHCHFRDLFNGVKPKFLRKSHQSQIDEWWDQHITDATFKSEFIFNGRIVDILSGGIHTRDEPYIYKNKHGKLMFVDVSSYYPNIMVNQEIYPPHVDKDSLLGFIKSGLEAKAKAKQEKDKVAEAFHKLTLNSLYGQLGNRYGRLYHPIGRLAVCVVGQIRLLQLMELLEHVGFKVKSANTDGLMVLIGHDQESMDKFREICDLWSKTHNYKLDEDQIIGLYAKNINNYISVFSNGTVKSKGVYDYSPYVDFMYLMKNPKFSIVYEAVKQYMMDGTPVEKTIRECQDIFMFLQLGRSSSGYTTHAVTYDKDEELQRSNRFYIALPSDKTYELKKRKILEDGTVKEITMSYGLQCVVVNNIPNEFPTDIDLEFYIGEANKIISEFEPTAFKLMETEKLWCGVNHNGDVVFPKGDSTGTWRQALSTIKKSKEKYVLGFNLIPPYYAIPRNYMGVKLDTLTTHIPVDGELREYDIVLGIYDPRNSDVYTGPVPINKSLAESVMLEHRFV